MDGRLLALAREEKASIRERSLAEEERRRRTAYARSPRLRAIDTRLIALVREFTDAVLGQGRPVEEIRQEGDALHGERAAILAANGWPADWLDGAWACPRCRDTGYVEGRMCSCLEALYEKERARDLSALLKLGDESFDRFDLSYYSDVPDAEGRSARRQMETVFGFCRDYADTFGPGSVDLLLRGGTGLGKTFLSACIAREVSKKGVSVVYETAVAALAAFEAQKFHPSDEADERVRRLLSCELLILDDLGTELVTDFTRSALYTLVNSRLLAGHRTIISTNLTMDELERLYTPQLCSRLRGEYQDLPFVGTDIRLLKKERGL